jgi:hypothetical protein
MIAFLTTLFRPARKHTSCADLLPLDDVWLRRGNASRLIARAAQTSVHAHG